MAVVARRVNHEPRDGAAGGGPVKRRRRVGAEWVAQADIDEGAAAGLTTEDRSRIRELGQENRELRRANAILKSASAFFAAEPGRPLV